MPIKLPRVSLSIVPGNQTATVAGQRVLLVGQLLTTGPAAGSATPGLLSPDVPNDGSEDTLFGQTSHLAGLVRAYKKENKVSVIDALPLSDAGAAVKGTGVITLSTGPATADAVIYVSIGSAKDFREKISIVSGDTVTEIADKFTAAFALKVKAPYTVANASGVVTATAENGGTLCNEWGISVEGVIPGVAIAITAWASGATDPVLTSILDAIGNTRYQTILWPSNYDISVVQTLLDARFNIANDVKDGVVIQNKIDTLSNLKTYVSSFNSQSVVVPVQVKVNTAIHKGPATLEMPDISAAQICAIRALRLTVDAPLTQYLTTVSPLDQFGGPELSSLPYFNTAMPNHPIESPVNQSSDVDILELTNAGLSTFGPNQAFNGTIFGEMVTTYLTDNVGNPDTNFKFLNTIDMSSTIREFYFNNLKSRFAQSRLTNGVIVPDRDMANEATIRAFCVGLYVLLAQAAITQSGDPAVSDYIQNLSITLDVPNGQVTINQAPLLVSQLRSVLGTIQVNFGG